MFAVAVAIYNDTVILLSGRSLATVAVLVALAALAPGRAVAAETSRGAAIVVDVAGVPMPLRDPLRSEIRTALARQGLTILPAGASSGVSRISFQMRAPLEILVQVDDGLTGKTLSRRLNLSTFPPDAQALAVALTASELLTAAWLELDLRTRENGDSEPPPEVKRVVTETLRARVVRNDAAGIAAAFERYTGGEALLGAEAFWLHWFSQRLAWEGSVGVRRGLASPAPHGDVRLSALGAQLTLWLRAWGNERWRWLFGPALRGGVAVLEGRPAAGATGSTTERPILVGRLNMALLLHAGPHLEWRLLAGLGWPLLGVRALDQNQAVTGTTGLEANLQLGAALRF